MHELTVKAVHGDTPWAEQPHGVVSNRVEYGLRIRWRARNHLKNLSGRGQIPVARLELFEQANVLDGDDRLVGKRLEEADRAVGVPTGFAPRDGESPDGDIVPHHGHDQQTSISETTPEGSVVLRGIFVLDVRN